MDKRANKKTGEELQMYLHFRKRGGKVPAKKGKGSYDRKKMKKEVAQDGQRTSLLSCNKAH